ncbi:MAG: hypothetical protein NC223_06950 [Butyrivibrio sp.]|nr:hypothetical protein [Butyrivibrio sp.]
MRKIFLSALLVCAVLVFITGCTKSMSTGDNPNKETETAKQLSAEPQTLYKTNPLFENEKISCIKIYNEIEKTTVEITSEKEIQDIVAMFNNWNMEANKVPENHILDADLYVEIAFNDVLMLRISSSIGAEENYYGSIGDTYYYLPQEFWGYVYSKIN